MPGRRLGQHFLFRAAILERIAAALSQDVAGTVIEIGPGKGTLTEHLLRRAARLIAIEIDPVLVHYLEQKFRPAPNVTIVASDVLKVDLSQWGSVSVIGNLPYYITSPIVERVLRLGPLLQTAVFLVQKEVAIRMTATPGSRDYGFLSVQTQLLSEAEILFTVSPSAFKPPPKVDSAVVRLVPRGSLLPAIDPFLDFVRHCFHQKRKTLRNNLRPFYDPSLVDALPQAGKRAEQLSIAELIEVHQRILRG